MAETFRLPNGEETDDPYLAVGAWEAEAKIGRTEEAARCALLCAERAAAHRRTMAAGSGDVAELEHKAREADKCADTIKHGKMPDGSPASCLASVHATCLAERDQLRFERDRADLAFRELHSSHRALEAARDEAAARFVVLRDKVLAYEEQLAVRAAKCFLCGDETEPLAGNPGRWPVHLGNDRDAHVACVNLVLRAYEAGCAVEAAVRST